MATQIATGNLVLDALSPEGRDAILRTATEVDLERGRRAFQAGRRISHVYFPIDAVASLVVLAGEGTGVEAAMLGRDTIVGLPVALGQRSLRNAHAIIQVPGRGYAVTADAFEALVADHGKLRELTQALTIALLTEVGQSVACNRLHPADERLARWLARVQDGGQRDTLPLTQEFIAEMLGVRRATVTVAAQTLQQEELIEYRRGRISILDREGLRGRACHCYHVVTSQHRRVFEAE